MIISDGGKVTLGSEAPQSPLFIADWVLRHNALWESKGGGEGLKKKKKKTISLISPG